eukprot:Phypoly_transcript_22015.p1 GENE.Phypoly_transcript_22015~~Phypoly_transcript_22015.p1  ORF type:complete len:110 (+),score=18.54 Phypoly_transcript_22015:197-526(+)
MASSYSLVHLLQQTYDFVLDTKHAIFSGTKEITFIASFEGQEIVRIAKVPIRQSFNLAHFLSLLFVEVPLKPSLLSYSSPGNKEVFIPIAAPFLETSPSLIRVHFSTSA